MKFITIKKINISIALLIIIILLGLFFRSYNLNWDSGYKFHPDERAIILFTLPLELPNSASEFFSKESSLNPNFFAYGSLPLYLLKFSSIVAGEFDSFFSSYDKIQMVGRTISVFADTTLIFLVYILGKILWNRKTGLLAAFFYAVAVFPIQTSHFFTADTLLSFFMILTLYQILRFVKKPNTINIILVGLFFGLSLATKISALPLIGVIVAGIFLSTHTHSKNKHILTTKFILPIFIIILSSFIAFIVFEPYALIDLNSFISQTQQQSQMGKDPYIFPYTLQYVTKIPYLHEIKNILLWGLGPVLGILSIIGILFAVVKIIITKKVLKNKEQTIVLIYLLGFFLLFGSFAVGWMRYLLPLYPIFILFAAYFSIHFIFPFIGKIIPKNKNKVFIEKTLLILFLLTILVWPFSFLKIYDKENTRIRASKWIDENIKKDKTIAIEHWDDGLPVFGGANYNILTLELYDPDSKEKWIKINSQLEETDYIILASNRLYVPLQKLSECNKYKKCYPKTAEYYKDLFSGNLGFEKIAEFTSFPTVPFLNIEINDQSADESFTVYDHPKVMIFQKQL